MGFVTQSPLAEVAWARATALRTFSITDLASELRSDASTIGPFVRDWEGRGWVERVGPGVAHVSFRVIAGPQPEPSTGGSRETNMWRAMRGLGGFTPIDIAAHADTGTVRVTVEDARAYIGVLFRHDYLRCTRKADPSKGREASYKLIRNTGPKAPILKRIRAVIDPNTGEHHIREGKL